MALVGIVLWGIVEVMALGKRHQTPFVTECFVMPKNDDVMWV